LSSNDFRRGGLTGIAGTMTIIIAGGKHNYEFAYTIKVYKHSAGASCRFSVSRTTI
jgi:hypothetical protein